MKNISIRVTEEQYYKILEQSSKEGVTMTEFILTKCEVINKEQDLTVASVMSEIKKLPEEILNQLLSNLNTLNLPSLVS